MEEPFNNPEETVPVRASGSFRSSILETAWTFVLALVLVFGIRTYVVQPFYVKGQSMEPNFLDHEYLVIDELSYRFHSARRGDVVVLRPPGNAQDFYIKRIIGLPGETVTIRDGKITIQNSAHPEGFVLSEQQYLGDAQTDGPVHLTLSSDDYFVLGDNRAASRDSRSFGALPRDRIVGRVWVRGWPLSRVMSFQTPIYP